ncbi:uncharacterized protein LOC109717574 [Ananas comosus]|uniref:Uncharacterized protein LOC109717574 n=1 Tax=Ananas comosus TaxID=4615 RepID=A0A6P5G193_ANACO|nr:uncharacterized protein LOC109717574 [Ananas comosus]
MKDLASCFGEHMVCVSDVSCFGSVSPRSHVGPTLSVSIDDSFFSSSSFPSTMMCHLLRKKKGSRSVTTSRVPSIFLSWDASSAKYMSGPEPVANFYLFVSVDGEPTSRSTTASPLPNSPC